MVSFSPDSKSKASVVEVTLESRLRNVEVAEEISRRVAATAGFGPEAAFQIEMAVHETVINAIHHGNMEDPGKSVLLRFLIFENRVEIHVRDQGRGFDPDSLADPIAEENLLNVSGRGIFLVRKFMDEFKVETSVGCGTEVIMVKHRNPEIQSNQGGTDCEHEGDSASG
ncbi:MAG: ATP-binding protein [Acidobacteria bacterium]|nr:ATP-binding protein [Acidobacteriota bacterium]